MNKISKSDIQPSGQTEEQTARQLGRQMAGDQWFLLHNDIPEGTLVHTKTCWRCGESIFGRIFRKGKLRGWDSAHTCD